jgi:hypothetical protein
LFSKPVSASNENLEEKKVKEKAEQTKNENLGLDE